MLAALGALLGAVTIGNTITIFVRRRRDLAILKTLRFRWRHITATLAGEATFMLVAAGTELPVGVAAGRWARTWQPHSSNRPHHR